MLSNVYKTQNVSRWRNPPPHTHTGLMWDVKGEAGEAGEAGECSVGADVFKTRKVM